MVRRAGRQLAAERRAERSAVLRRSARMKASVSEAVTCKSCKGKGRLWYRLGEFRPMTDDMLSPAGGEWLERICHHCMGMPEAA